MVPILCDRCRDIVVNASAEEEVDGCNLLDELAQLDALLAHLTTKRDNLKRKINRFRSPIVRQLLPDVMSIIFELCLPDFAAFQLSPSPLDLSVPLSLGAVCKYWREIVWSTPSLWSSLVVCVIPSKCDLQTAIVQEWLARSGQLPLSIRIFTKPFTPQNESAVLALAGIINQYSTRWSDLDLCIPQILCRYFHATDNHAPILKSIRFNGHHFDYHGRDDMENFQLTSPCLQQAYISLFQPHHIDIQWDNLTHLYLVDMTVPDYLLILRKTPQLVFFSFASMDGLAPWGQIAEAPIITSLKSLQVRSMNYFTEKFLDIISCPHLEELSLGPSYVDAPVELIISLIKRSACSLRSFAIMDTFAPSVYKCLISEDLMQLLQLMPSLKKLSIRVTPSGRYNPSGYLGRWNILVVVAKAISSQREVHQQQSFLPNLEILEYTGKLCLRLGNYAELYPLPPADNAVKGPLRSIKFDLYPAIRIPTDAISFFLSLMERGLTVDVCSRSQDILQSSINRHKAREEPFRHDWVDDLDLSLMQDLP